MGYTAVQYTDCYSEPMSTRFLNSISGGICRQNTQFNMYSTTSKQQEVCTFKDSHPYRQILTNSNGKLSPRAVNRGDVLTACFRDIQRQRSIRMAFVIIMILFDVTDYRLLYGNCSISFGKNINMTVKIFCVCSSVDVCGTKARMDTYKYSLV